MYKCLNVYLILVKKFSNFLKASIRLLEVLVIVEKITQLIISLIHFYYFICRLPKLNCLFNVSPTKFEFFCKSL